MAHEPGDAVLLAEIARRARRRFIGVWICAVAAALFGAGVLFAQRMMHGEGYRLAQGRIVALGTSSSGEPTFTGEFRDADGVLHRDTETYGYHYAPGDPRLGERVGYLYRIKPATGSFDSFPRGDVILHWTFGVPAVAFVLFGALAAALIVRESRYRRWLVANGQREPLAHPAIRERAVALPAGAGSQVVRNWRLEGKYFLPAAGEYVEAHGDWEPPPVRELQAGAEAPVLLLDPRDPSRYWLPSGAPP